LPASIYTYDDLNRLTGVCYDASCAGSLTPASCLECVGSPMSLPAPDLTPNSSDLETTWTYDSVGNRLTEDSYVGTTTYAYDAADRLTSADPPGSGPIAYTYDDNGNQTSNSADSFEWDYADRLVSATVNSATELDNSDAAVRTYSYGLGPISQLTASDGTVYLHADGLGSITSATDPTGDPMSWAMLPRCLLDTAAAAVVDSAGTT
jgi:YD repeat-containing protein